jgi:FixJ family two-component response regulator
MDHSRPAATETVHLLHPLTADHLLDAHSASSGRRVCVHTRIDGFLAAYRDDGPSCLVVDVASLTGGLPQLFDRLRARRAELSVVVVVGQGDVATAVAALRTGAGDVLTRPVEAGALRAAVRGALYHDMVRRTKDAWRREARAKVSLLTAREREVFALVVAGLTSSRIGEALGITQKTVEAHRSSIASKLETKNIFDLVLLAIQAGVLPEWPADVD